MASPTGLVPLVEVLAALPGPTVARDLNILNGEFVVVGELLSLCDASAGKDDDVFLASNLNYTGEAVGLIEKKAEKQLFF